MHQIIKSLPLFTLLLAMGLFAEGTQKKNEDSGLLAPRESQERISAIDAYINHHVKDAHDFTLWSDSKTGKHYGFSLPVIIWDNGLHVFSSSKFHHGESVAEVAGNFYTIYHGKIYKTDAQGSLLFDDHDHPTNKAVLDFSITKNVLGILVAMLILFLLFTSLARSYKKGPIPTGVGRVLEPLVLYVRDEIAIPNIGEKKHRKYMGYLLTVFFFIWVLNLMGMTPIGFNVTGHISVTFFLALLTYLITQFTASKAYWSHIFWMPGVPVPMKIFLIPIEILGTLTKPFALMVRLFANISAGHIIIMSLLALAFVWENAIAGGITGFLLALFLFVIELLVAFLQAYIFTLLTSLFIGLAVQDDHH